MSASDNSSLTPSQSASQTVARSVETSHSGLTSKEHEHLQPDEKQETTTTTFKSQARPVRASDDLTITLPPAYAISELALPTGVLAQSPSPDNGHSTPTPNAGTQPAPALIRKRTKRSRRPISQHITEASHEDSDGPSSVSNRNATASPRVPHTPFPNTRIPANDTSSDDEQPTGPLQVVENDPFEVIRRSMLGPTGASASPLLAGTAPTARASAPDVRASASYDTSPSKIMFPAPVSGHGQSGGIGMGLPSTSQASPKRQRRTSLLFGSLRGLFRKPKERGRVGADWDDGHLSPSPSSNLTRAKTSGGWVTRTDARVKGRRGEDSDEEAMSKEVRRRKTTATATATTMTTNEANLGRSASRARLRKGRPGASNGTSVAPSHRAGVDGWITDSPGGAGAGTVTASGSGVGAGAGPSRSRTRRGTMKRKKISVAELRGNDQGHTDGEVDGAHQPLERMASTVRGKAPEATVSRPIAEVQEEKQVAVPTNPNPTAEPNVSVSPGTQPRRATTTTATSSRKPSSDAALAHRRSASMSYVDAQLATVVASMSTQAMPMSTSTGGSMSWRKPPPQIEPQSQQVSPSSSRTYESQPKPNARRHLGNGHAKHAQNQSLMSIVADVTRQDEDQALVMDKTRSLDIPRAPGSVLRDQHVGGAQRGGMNGAGHGRTTSEDVGTGQAQAQAQRDIKMPLRSALRNASRTPSPSPATVPAIVPAGQVRKEAGVEEQRGRGSGSVSPPWRDSASISSYETGRESWDGEPSSPVRSQSRSPVVRSQSQPPAIRRAQSPVLINHVDARPSTRSRSPSPPPFTFPPPPVDPPPVRPSNMHSHSNSLSNLNGNRASNGTEHGNDPPSSTVSTETPPVRRKSVRVSLQPTFSPTPPALNDEDGDDDGGGAGERYAPWNGREPLKTNTKTTTGDVWADSSEEDEVYKRARRLLSLVGRGRT
ncbi:hypothetical protein L210DRAFT_3452969 [Boletus edulis BED1]|uniref:Uncharacterized protein n=1 Tax=Boletus edulis BED1 TaxID=1328754 RepID=A0AAD4BNL4_BOLED|nr:hypothetical protein L210DRAFT_3452969 [Boletus edulis BED1]